MFVTTCRRCGETALGEDGRKHLLECAGEAYVLCPRCHGELRDWFRMEMPRAPELEEEAAGR